MSDKNIRVTIEYTDDYNNKVKACYAGSSIELNEGQSFKNELEKIVPISHDLHIHLKDVFVSEVTKDDRIKRGEDGTLMLNKCSGCKFYGQLIEHPWDRTMECPTSKKIIYITSKEVRCDSFDEDKN
ncbi:MAG: hypothetical protein WC783_00835 [Candidatus Paceibacterota bacterium]|jgi:hypothetical protein